MRSPFRLLISVILLAQVVSDAHAQLPAPPQDSGGAAASEDSSPVKPKQPTTITSDQFNLDLGSNEGTFTGNVVVTSTDFRMKADVLNLYFAPGNELERLVAKGNVRIDQPGRTTTGGEVEYFVKTGLIVLTIDPRIEETTRSVEADKIMIWRNDNRLQTQGNSKTILKQGGDALGTP